MQPHRRPCRRSARVLVLVVLAAALAGCDLGASGHAAATATLPPTVTALPTATPGQQLPAFSGEFGPAPTHCPASPALQIYQTNNFGGGFSGNIAFLGGKPVWELGMGSVVKLVRGPSGYYTTKVMWVVGPNYNLPVTLTAADLQGGAPLWFDIYPSNSGPSPLQDLYTTSAVLDPGTPNRGSSDNSTGHWNIWGIGLFAFHAGCYDFTATWATGSWHTILAVGS